MSFVFATKPSYLGLFMISRVYPGIVSLVLKQWIRSLKEVQNRYVVHFVKIHR